MLSKTSAALVAFGFLGTQSLLTGVNSEAFSSLLRQSGASDSDLKLFSQDGGVFAKVLPHVRRGEIAAVGAVQIPVPIDFFVTRFRDIETFKKGPAVLILGKFGDPPRKQNVERLTLEKKDLDALAGCRPRKCGLKLSAEMMSRLRSAAATFRSGPKLEEEFRSVLIDYLASYMEKGTRAMITYSDIDPPVQSAREFLELLKNFSWLKTYSPVLFRTLEDPVRIARPEIEDFLYWSKESFGLKPVVSMTHVMILKTTIEGKPWAFIASKQIYADHYFETSLGLTVLAGESISPANPLTSIAYFNRSETDGLRGWFASVERSIVERRARAEMAKNLSEMKGRLGKSYLNQSGKTAPRPPIAR